MFFKSVKLWFDWNKSNLPFFVFTLLVAPLFAYSLYLLLQEMAGKDPATRTPTRPKLPAPRRPSPSHAPSGSTSEPVDAPLSSEYPRLTPSPGYHPIPFNSWIYTRPPLKNCWTYFKILLATRTYFPLLPCSQRREGQEILLGLLLQVCRSRPPPHLPEAQHHLLQAVRIHPRRMYSLLLPNQEI